MTTLVSTLRDSERCDNTPTSQRLYELARSALVSLLNHIWRLNIETAQLDEKVN